MADLIIAEVEAEQEEEDGEDGDVSDESISSLDEDPEANLEFLKNPNMRQFRDKKQSDDEDESSINHSLIIDEDDSNNSNNIDVRRKRKKYDDDKLEDDDYDLLEENLGVKLKRRKFKRIRHEEDDSDEEEIGEREQIANQLFDDDDLLDIEVNNTQQERNDQYDSDESESDADDFIVEDDGYIARNKNQDLGDCTDASLNAARDIFGMEFDYDEINAAGMVESDDDDEEERTTVRHKSKSKSYLEIYEPSLLERAGMTLEQRAIRKADIPERFLLRGPKKLTIEEIEKLQSNIINPEIEEEIDEEAKWIFDNLFKCKKHELLELSKDTVQTIEDNEAKKKQFEETEAAKASYNQCTEENEDINSIVGDGIVPIAPTSLIGSTISTRPAFNPNFNDEEGEYIRPVFQLPKPTEENEVQFKVPAPPPPPVISKNIINSIEMDENTIQSISVINNNDDENECNENDPPRSTIVEVDEDHNNIPRPITDDEWNNANAKAAAIAAIDDEWNDNESPNTTTAITTTTNNNTIQTCITKEIIIEELEPKLREEYEKMIAIFQKKLSKIITFIRVKHYEIPFISYYQKDDVEPEFSLKDLWGIYKYDYLFQQYNKRKESLLQQLNNMKLCLSDENKIEIIDRILNDMENIKYNEELESLFTFFKLSFINELPWMRNILKENELKARMIMNEDSENEDGGMNGNNSDKEEGEIRVWKMFRKQIKNMDNIHILINRFGLTSYEFAQNLNLNYIKNEITQGDETPFQEALKLVNDLWPSAPHILNTAKREFGKQIANDPLAKKAVKKIFTAGAFINVTPTRNGLQIIDENHPIYSMKYLSRKPINTFKQDQFLYLTIAEKDKLINITYGEHMVGVKGLNYIVEAKEYFFKDGYSTVTQSWNFARADVVQIAFDEFLLPELRKELKIKMLKEANEYILEKCSEKFFNYIKVGPHQVEDDELIKNEFNSVVGISYSVETTYVVGLDKNGVYIDSKRLNNFTKSLNSRCENYRFEKDGDLTILKEFIKQICPKVIVIGGESRNAINYKYEIMDLLNELGGNFSKINIEIIDNELAKVYGQSNVAKEEFPDYSSTLRESISLGRKILDPLFEYTQLCNVDDEILCLKFHPLQDQLQKEELLETLQIILIDRTNEVGVDLNDVGTYFHHSNILQFICGFGKQKADYFLKLIRLNRLKLENRSQLVTVFNIGPCIFINCSGFIKINVSGLSEDTESYIEIMDSTRIHPEHYEWAKKMAKDSKEEEDDDDAGAVEDVMEHPERLADLDLDKYAEIIQDHGYEYKRKVLGDMRIELGQSFQDFRTKFQSATNEELFYMLTKETEESFRIGKLVTATVIGIKRQKPDKFTLENAMPDKEDITRCPICFQLGFKELEQFWTHFDNEDCPGPAVGINYRLDNHIAGIIPIEKLSDTDIKDPSTRVKIGQTIFCRIESIEPERFFTHATSKSSDLADKFGIYKPKKDEYYDISAELEQIKKNEDEKLKKKGVYTKRVIIHPCFKNISYQEAENNLLTMDQGDVIIRPSSKGTDHLTLSWKVVQPNIIQHIDILELGKRTPFTIGTKLQIDTEEYDDLDEIIARCINPMASNARDIINFKYYNDQMENRDEINEYIKNEKNKNPNKIHYIINPLKDLPGKFTIIYMPGSRVFQEYLTLLPCGIKFRGQIFDNFKGMLNWFKLHYLDVGGTPRELSEANYRVINKPTMTPSHAIPLPSPIIDAVRDAVDVITDGKIISATRINKVLPIIRGGQNTNVFGQQQQQQQQQQPKQQQKRKEQNEVEEEDWG